MEPRLGHDFSHVRVHTDAKAAESARAVNALAYTVGQNVVFGARQYEPHASEGRRLLAHELTHVVQQGTMYSTGSVASLDSESSSAERNADSSADTVIAGRTVPTIPAVGYGIQRRAAPYIKKVTVHLTPPQS